MNPYNIFFWGGSCLLAPNTAYFGYLAKNGDLYS